METKTLGKRVWLSHARDEPMADPLARILQDAGFQVRDAQRTIAPGQSIDEKILHEIARSDLVVALVSKDAERNRNVASEIAYAVVLRRKEGRPAIVPVVVDHRAHVPFLLRGVQPLDLTRAGSGEAMKAQVLAAVEGAQRAGGKAVSDAGNEWSLVLEEAKWLEHEARSERLHARASFLAATIAGLVAVATSVVAFARPGLPSADILLTIATGVVGVLFGFYFGRGGLRL